MLNIVIYLGIVKLFFIISIKYLCNILYQILILNQKIKNLDTSNYMMYDNTVNSALEISLKKYLVTKKYTKLSKHLETQAFQKNHESGTPALQMPVRQHRAGRPRSRYALPISGI
jgi:hypothetical protein